MRQERLARIFHSLYRRERISRDEIAQAASLSAASVSIFTNSLLDAGVLKVSGALPSRGGRRAALLELNAKSRYLCGVDLQGRDARIGLVDLGGSVCEVVASPFSRIVAELRRFLKKQRVPVLAIGISTPELLDPERRRMISSHRVPWPGVDVGQLVERETRVPAFLTRSVDAAALGEKWFGGARASDNCLVVTWGEGIGCGMLIGGELYSGSSLLSGEFGHTMVDPRGRACYCGKRGCLEMYASSESVGLRLADLVQVFNPEQIILGGPKGLASLTAVGAAVRRYAMPAHTSSLRISASMLGPDAGVQGAAASALQQLIDAPGGMDRVLH